MDGRVVVAAVLIVISILVFFMFAPQIVSMFNNFFSNIGKSRLVSTGVVYTQDAWEAVRNTYQKTFAKAFYIISNPEAYATSYYKEAKPSEEVVEYGYSFSLSSIKVPAQLISYSGIIGKPLNPVEVYYYLSANLPKRDDKYSVSFRCKNRLRTYAFYKDVYKCVTGFVEESSAKPSDIEFSSYDIQQIYCSIPTFEINIKACPELNGTQVFVDNTLEAILYNIKSETQYKSLVVDAKVLAMAITRKENIYSLLKLSRENYERGVYYGIPNFPKVDISRAIDDVNFPIPIFEKEVSKSIFIIYFKSDNLEKIEKINSFEIEILYDPKKIRVRYAYENGCSDSYSWGGGRPYYDVSCNGNKCIVTFNERYWNKIYEAFPLYLIIVIPLCIEPAQDFKDYADLVIKSTIDYNYKVSSSVRVQYNPFYS